jgi:hypothetical protein
MQLTFQRNKVRSCSNDILTLFIIDKIWAILTMPFLRILSMWSSFKYHQY